MTRADRPRLMSRGRWIALIALTAAILIPAAQALLHQPGTESIPAGEIAVAVLGSLVLAALIAALVLALSWSRVRHGRTEADG